MDLSNRATLPLPRNKTLSIPPPRLPSAPSSASHNAFATFTLTLHLPLSLPPSASRSSSPSLFLSHSLSLFHNLSLSLSLSLSISLSLPFPFSSLSPPPVFLRSLEQPLACLPVFLLPPSRPAPTLPSFLTVGSRPRLVRTLPTRPPPLPLSSPVPTSVPAYPHTLHKKPKSSVGAMGGFSLRLLLPSSHHSSFTSPLTFSRPFSRPFPRHLPPCGPCCSRLSPCVSLLTSALPASVPLACPVSSRYTFASAVRSRVRRSVSLAPESRLSHSVPLASASDSQPWSNDWMTLSSPWLLRVFRGIGKVRFSRPLRRSPRSRRDFLSRESRGAAAF